MGLFDGLSSRSSFKNSMKNMLNNAKDTAINGFMQGANDVVRDALNYALNGGNLGGFAGGGIVNGKVGHSGEIAYAKSMLEMAMRIQFAQGWQWVVEADGMKDLFMFAKDVSYSEGTIETDAKIIGGIQFNKPTHITPGTVTITVRDDQTGRIAKWFDSRKSRVINRDGTINLAPYYVMNVRVYRVGFDGRKSLDGEFAVIPTERGATTRAYDQVGEFFSYPLTFVCHTSSDTSLTGMASAMAMGTAGRAVDTSSIIKF